MTYRDEETVLRERIEQLELNLARARGLSLRLADELDALRDELERLTRDPKALARVRRENQARSALFAAMRLIGAGAIGVVLVPTFAALALMMAEGEVGAATLCAIGPALIVLGVLGLKLPEIVSALELRFERKRRDATAAQRAKVRVEPDAEPLEHEIEARSRDAATAERTRGGS